MGGKFKALEIILLLIVTVGFGLLFCFTEAQTPTKELQLQDLNVELKGAETGTDLLGKWSPETLFGFGRSRRGVQERQEREQNRQQRNQERQQREQNREQRNQERQQRQQDQEQRRQERQQRQWQGRPGRYRQGFNFNAFSFLPRFRLF